MEKNQYKPAFTRDFTLAMLQVWYKCEAHNLKQWNGKKQKHLPYIIDEVGILCHAAIVSREFKIPCIVGTKFATKVFKDGDLVEVDADKGVVRKIK